MNSDIASNIARIKQKIAVAAARSGRDPNTIKLMAVTKTVAPERILQAVDSGITLLGENYVQEVKDKIPIIRDCMAIEKPASLEGVQKWSDARRTRTESRGVYGNTLSDAVGSATQQMSVFQQPLQWHMIGHLQTNKAKYAVKMFDSVQSVDRLELAQELSKRAGAIDRRLKILIEVNVSGEKSKSGVPAAEAIELIRMVAVLPHLEVEGLMTMAPYSDNPENARPYFRALRQLRNEIARAGIDNINMEELSMGMTDDFETAIEEGATIVRIGRAIFGERQ
jgi:PLP dependent protein